MQMIANFIRFFVIRMLALIIMIGGNFVYSEVKVKTDDFLPLIIKGSKPGWLDDSSIRFFYLHEKDTLKIAIVTTGGAFMNVKFEISDGERTLIPFQNVANMIHINRLNVISFEWKKEIKRNSIFISRLECSRK